MKRCLLLMSVLLVSACSQVPTHPMSEGKATVMIKPIMGLYDHRGSAIRLEYELVTLNGRPKSDPLDAVDFVSAGVADATYRCSINGQESWAHSSRNIIQAGTCYAPVLSTITDGISETQPAKWCSFELAEVDCNWLKKESQSNGKRMVTPPVPIKRSGLIMVHGPEKGSARSGS